MTEQEPSRKMSFWETVGFLTFLAVGLLSTPIIIIIAIWMDKS